MLKAGLYIISTPVGNLGDITYRSSEVLAGVDVIACEDTRVSKKLLTLLGLMRGQEFISCHEHNIDKVAENIVDMVKDGKRVALISDAGSPLICDPGALLVTLFQQNNLYYTALPGATAFVPALQMSGILTERFMFCGFLPNKKTARVKYLDGVKDYDTALLFYETPHRLLESLNDMRDVFIGRRCAVVREISKIYEETVNDDFDGIISHFRAREEIKGEYVIILGKPEKHEKKVTDDELKELLVSEMKTKSLRDAVESVAAVTGMKKKNVYSAALAVNDGK